MISISAISLRQSIIFALLLFLVNILAGQYNLQFNYAGNFQAVLDIWPAYMWCAFLYWASCQWRPATNIRLFLLPLFRTLFWSAIVMDGVLTDNRMGSEDFLFGNNEMFFWWTSLKIAIPQATFSNEFLEMFLMEIICIALGQFILIAASVWLEKKFRKAGR
jgi:hypothetical protein